MDPQRPQRDIVKVNFPVELNADANLSCVLCNLPKCELAIELRGRGRRVWVGLHTDCAGPYAVEGTR